MADDLLHIGEVQTHLNASRTRILKYSIELSHNGLNEHKTVTAPNVELLQTKGTLVIKKWADRWEEVSKKRRFLDKKQKNIELANEKTEYAQNALSDLENLLTQVINADEPFNWNTLKKSYDFKEKIPKKPKEGIKKDFPQEPTLYDDEFVPVFSFIDKLFTSRRERITKVYEEKYSNAHKKWELEKQQIIDFNNGIENEFSAKMKAWENEVRAWEERKSTFNSEIDEYNDKIDKFKNLYLCKDIKSIIEYCELILNNSEYPETFTKEFEVEYNPENSILVVEYQLPTVECFPKVKEVKYISSKAEFKEYFITDTQLSSVFDEVIYKIVLRSLHELFIADSANAIDAISFNGWVEAVNKATGQKENNCVISIQVRKLEFLKIDLLKVDPKTCFRSLKGVSGSKLSALTPIQPILQISRNDKRFIDSYNVVEKIDQATNLAAMDWEDFEHLIRELFEKEFQSNGGEVKVTQASRDGGVDAIAFDPDPIRGGKIIIQAKRYTNTVGVSAVRDLYGTIMNEGATKGILVSTADYGPDAYEFAKGKPITLLNGSNLLHLLEKHGHHAKIDLREAKRILKEQEKQ
jgi:restriction system protein